MCPRAASTHERLRALEAAFHAAHAARYSYSLPNSTVELVNLRVTATVPLPRARAMEVEPQRGPLEVARIGSRDVFFGAARGWITAACFERAHLGSGALVRGPAVLQQLDSTVALAPGEVGRIDLGSTSLLDLPLETVRRRVVVSESDPRLFTGTLRDELDPWGRFDDATILRTLSVASGEDVLEALADGLDSEVEERGRSFSGGQRQRLALTRALLTGAETLVLVEPTSAVDAHTEVRIAGRLAAAREGLTTAVMTASPLLLDQADRVLFLQRRDRHGARYAPRAAATPTRPTGPS